MNGLVVGWKPNGPSPMGFLNSALIRDHLRLPPPSTALRVGHCPVAMPRSVVGRRGSDCTWLHRVDADSIEHCVPRAQRYYPSCHANTHTHPFNGPFSGTTRVSRYQKGKPVWILLKQETVSGSGISWAICKSAPRCRQITTPTPHHSVFYRLSQKKKYGKNVLIRL